ncbi:MAG TPA: zf-HC2 domain-containing protein, partial [Treponemataceae bacterium]|nr:zf-HC2 domain-containing protein [Treponemataceae bacterium]
MSTCPDQDLYSAYVDGEVPSPWKEKLEAHASKCPTCRRAVERFASVSALVRSGVPELSGDQ